MFGMFPLHDEKEQDERTGLIGESPDFIRLGAEFSKEALQQVGGAYQRMQSWVKLIEFEGAFDPPVECVNSIRFNRFPFLVKGR